MNLAVMIHNGIMVLKTEKATPSATVWWENTKSSFKESARAFSKTSTAEKDIRISKPKKTKGYEICTKRKFRTKNQTND